MHSAFGPAQGLTGLSAVEYDGLAPHLTNVEKHPNLHP